MIREYLTEDIIFEAGKDKDSLGRVKFIWAVADIPNKNKRVYRKQILEKEIARVQGAIDKDGQFWSSPAHPEGKIYPAVSDISHKLSRVWMDREGKAWGEAEVLGTRAGRDLAVVLRKGKIGVSLRGEGTVNNEGDSEIVNDDFRLCGVDFTLAPSFTEAQAHGLFESAEFSNDNEGDDEDEELSDEEITEAWFSIRQALEDALRDEFNETAWVRDFSPDEAIVTISEFDPADKTTRETLLKIPYEIDGDGNVALDLKGVEIVKKKDTYEPVHENVETKYGLLSEQEMRITGQGQLGKQKKMELTADEERYLSPREAAILREEKFSSKK